MPAVLGAVYRPEAETVPPVADQVTAVLLEPVTLAVNCWVAPGCIDAEVGVTVIDSGAAVSGAPAAEVTPPQPLFAITAAKAMKSMNQVLYKQRIPEPLMYCTTAT